MKPDGVVVIGFDLDLHYSLETFDRDLEAAGLRIEQRIATWDLRPFDGGDYAVTIARRG